MDKKELKELFVKKATIKHSGKYTYNNFEYVNSHTKSKITCPKHGDFEMKPTNHLQGKGCPRCAFERNGIKMRKAVCGLGFFDGEVGDYNSKCKKAWCSMLARCYRPTPCQKSYKDVQVCDEWLIYSIFKKWFDENYIEGYALDKDILVKGNRVYGPNTCCFVPVRINSMICKGKKIKQKDLPQGVNRLQNKFRAEYQINGDKKSVYIGIYNTPEEAFAAYKAAKESYIKEVATSYYNEGKITEKVYNALMNFEIQPF